MQRNAFHKILYFQVPAFGVAKSADEAKQQAQKIGELQLVLKKIVRLFGVEI